MGQNQNNGGGSPKVPPTPAEQDAIRRAAKARRKGATGRFGTSVAHSRNSVVDREQRELEAYQFRCNQALKAKEHQWYSALKPGSVAHRYAQAVIDAFVLADSDKSTTRTQCAEVEAFCKMSSEDMQRGNAIEHGRKVARKALSWAYEQLTRRALSA